MPSKLHKQRIISWCIRSLNESLKYYDQAIQLDPNNLWSYKRKGLTLYGLNKYNEAIEFQDKSIQLNPLDAKSYAL